MSGHDNKVLSLQILWELFSNIIYLSNKSMHNLYNFNPEILRIYTYSNYQNTAGRRGNFEKCFTEDNTHKFFFTDILFCTCRALLNHQRKYSPHHA
jgi:hypothetical protein